MSVIANEISSGLDSLLKVTKDSAMEQTAISGGFFILDHEPTGIVASPPRCSSNTSAVSIPYPSKYRCNGRIRLGSTNSPSSSSISSATANGSLSHQSLKESLNKTISSIIENYQEKVMVHNNSPSSSYSFTKHSTIIYSPTKASSKSPLSSSITKTKISKNNEISEENVLTIKKIKPISTNKESKLSEIAFGLKKKEIPLKLRRSSSDDTNLRKVSVNIVDDDKVEEKEKKEELSIVKTVDDKKEVSKEVNKEKINKEEIKKEEDKKEVKNEVDKVEIKKEEIEKQVKEDKNEVNENLKENNNLIESVIEKIDKIELTKPNENIKSIEAIKTSEKTESVKIEKPIKITESEVLIKKDGKKSLQKTENKIKKLAELEVKKEKEMLKKKKATHKKTLSLPNILTPLTPLSGMDEIIPQPAIRKRRKSVNFSSESFKSICVFTTTDKPENIRNSKIEVKNDDPENDKKDKEYSELRNYESAWSPVPRNVIHIQKFKSSKAKHVQYELPVSIQSFKLVRSNEEETEDKLTCLKVTLNVQNLNYEKKVVIRYTVDKWKTFKEIEAKYIKCIREATKEEGFGIKGVVGLERFVARIPVGEHFVLEEKPGHICNQRPTKMLLVARYEVNNNTYWDNNDFTDYHIELVRINAGYDVPRVSKHGKPIPCPGCCMSGRQNSLIENKGKEVKNNKRTVRKIGGVFGNFTEAVGKNNERTNFMADRKKGNLYMGMDGNENKKSSSTISTDEKKQEGSESKITKVLTEEPKSIGLEEKTNSSYNFDHSLSMNGGSKSSMQKTNNSNSSINPSPSSTSSLSPSSSYYGSSSIYSGSSISSKYNPPESTTSSLYPYSSMGISSTNYGSSNTGYSPYDINSQSKYGLPSYGGVGYNPSIYGGDYPSNSSSSKYNPPSDYPSNTSSSKYNPPSEYPENNFSKYDPPNSYINGSYSSNLSYPSSKFSNSNFNSSFSSASSPYGSSTYSSSSPYNPYDPNKQSNTQYGNFSEYNFGTDLKKKAQNINNKTEAYSPYSGMPTNSKYDIPFSTYSSFGDNYYSISPSAVTY